MTRLTNDEVWDRAARALGKVDLAGMRGCTLVTMLEIEAMAAALAMVGLTPIYPGSYPPPSSEPPKGQAQ